jgi:hypothetical protein
VPLALGTGRSVALMSIQVALATVNREFGNRLGYLLRMVLAIVLFFSLATIIISMGAALMSKRSSSRLWVAGWEL